MDLRAYEDLKPVFKFISNKYRQYECCNCYRLIAEPWTGSCLHQFCGSCINQQLRNGFIFCPKDHQRLSKDHLEKDPLVLDQIKYLEVFCPSGCTEVCRLRDIEMHLQHCELAAFPCPDCGVKVTRPNMLDHLQNQCNYRSITCRWCHAPVAFNVMNDHYAVCPMKPAECPDCHKSLPRPQMNLHMQSCPERKVKCKYAELGCTFQGRDIKEHESDNVQHFHMLLAYNLKRKTCMDLTMVEMKAKFEELTNENKLLKDSMDHNNDILAVVKEHVDLLSKKVVAVQKYLTVNNHINNSTMKIAENDEVLPNNALLVLQQKLAEVEVLTKNTADILQQEKSNRAGEQMMNKTQEFQFNRNEQRLLNLRDNVRNIMQTSHNGIFIWKLESFSRLQEDALSGKNTSLYSTPFYTDQYGYKVCLNVHPAGDDDVRGTELSIFIVVLKGEMDEILPWPIKYKATLMLMDQVTWKAHYQKQFLSKGDSSSSQKPRNDRNQGYGFTKFCDLEMLTNNQRYLVDDTLFVKAVIEVK